MPSRSGPGNRPGPAPLARVPDGSGRGPSESAPARARAAAGGGPRRHKAAVFAGSREGVRAVVEAVERDAALRDYFRPLRLVGKGAGGGGGGGRSMTLREQVHPASSTSPPCPPSPPPCPRGPWPARPVEDLRLRPRRRARMARVRYGPGPRRTQGRAGPGSDLARTRRSARRGFFGGIAR